MKTEIITAAAIQYFPLAQLYVSDLNPRQDADPEGIDLLADSLAMIGLIQNLGKVLFNDYVLPFEISSVLFLSAMVGAVVIGKKD